MSEPQRRSRFEIQRLLGRGAMGAVYLAQDTVIDRAVALKTVHLDSLQDQPVAAARPRLAAEARTAGRLTHPGIVAVYDVLEEADGRSLSIAMEYVEGTNLAELLRQAVPLPLEKALDVAAQIAEGLAYAHAQGVIHRDVKPENVLLTADGRVKIADFGIAHLLDSALSEDLRFLGTPSYMAPERLRGEAVDQRSDLFSLGVVLYEMVTRRLPFEGDTVAAVTRRIVGEPFTPVERYLPEAPAAVVAILRRALEKEPQRRYGSAAEMAADLRRALASRQQLRRTQPVPLVVPETALLPEIELPPLPPLPPPAASPAPAAPPARRDRWLRLAEGALATLKVRWRWAAAALALLVLVVLGIAWLRSRGAASPGAIRAQAARPAHLAALREGLARLRQGDLAAAERFLRSARLLESRSPRAALYHRLALAQIALSRRVESGLALYDQLAVARAEIGAGHLAAGRAALEAARRLDPEHPAIAELEAVLRVPAPPPAPALPAAPAAAAPLTIAAAQAPRVLPLETAGRAGPAQLLLDFQSESSRGALTIYSGEQQVFREGFRFVEKTRFLLTRGTAGAFTRTLEHPSGDIDLRVYLSLPRLPTQVVRVEGHLEGGTTRVLRIRVAADGGFTARLQ